MRTKKVKVPKPTRRTKAKAAPKKKTIRTLVHRTLKNDAKKAFDLPPLKKRPYNRKPKVVYTDADLREVIAKVNEIAKACKAELFLHTGYSGDRITGFKVKL